MQIFGMNIKKASDKKDGKNDIYFILLPTMLGICLCVACLVGSTFAWFTATQSTPVHIIQAASYNVTAEIKTADNTVLIPKNGVYDLASGIYTLTLTATGDASTGYCSISLTDSLLQVSEFHTVQFPTKVDPIIKSITFTLNVGEKASMEITPQLGTSSKTIGKWENGKTYNYLIEAEYQSAFE